QLESSGGVTRAEPQARVDLSVEQGQIHRVMGVPSGSRRFLDHVLETVEIHQPHQVAGHSAQALGAYGVRSDPTSPAGNLPVVANGRSQIATQKRHATGVHMVFSEPLLVSGR